MTHQSIGAIDHPDSNRKTDYLYRVSMKGLVQNERGEVLVVKETGRDWWDLPGGGMDHDEDIRTALAREMAEEVCLEGDFAYQVLSVDEPMHLAAHDFWQIRLIFAVQPDNMTFSAGEDGDEIAFMRPETFQHSDSEPERRIYAYAQIAAARK